MTDSRKPLFRPQVKARRQTEFNLEPCVAQLEAHGLDRASAMLAVTSTVLELFPHWVVKEDQELGLYAIARNPRVLARLKRNG